MQINPRHHNPPTDPHEQAAEWALCAESPIYFITAYAWVFNATEEAWIPFDLWPAQGWALRQLRLQRLVVALKARQLGMTWLVLGYCLWLMLFRPAATIGIFSRTETDAADLLTSRLKGMYDRLPAFLRCRAVVTDNAARWELSNGSVALAFATTGGRGYTFSAALVDEADFQPDLPVLMAAVKPTIDAGGAMILLSTSDKSKPGSLFKNIYRAAKLRQNEWFPIFLPWHARPGRSRAWYEAQRRDTFANTGSLDDLHQEYPGTATEALAPRTLDKRIPAGWIEKCYQELPPLDLLSLPAAPSVPGLEVYKLPQAGRRYVIGCDPAEGNPTSDDSALTVLDRVTGEEVAALAGKFQPQTIADHALAVGRWYNAADVLVERNNHGHAVILRLLYQEQLRVLAGLDERAGWLSNQLGKVLLYDALADAFRQKTTILHSFASYTQIASIEGNTLRAPEGAHDDRADCYALANVARALSAAADGAAGAGLAVVDEGLEISPY
jgi:hypothetical protein